MPNWIMKKQSTLKAGIISMKNDEGTESKIKIFGNIFISFIGAGILGLPYAFKEVRLYLRTKSLGVGLKRTLFNGLVE